MVNVFRLFSKWLYAPSNLELSILYILLGAYFSVATNAVIPAYSVTFVMLSLCFISLIIFCRIFTLLIYLKSKLLKKYWLKWAQLGFITFILVILFGTNIGLCVRLKLSESSMIKEVDNAFSIPKDIQKGLYKAPPVTAGMFSIRVYKVESMNRTVWFHTEDGYALFWMPSLMGGIVYCEQGQPSEIGETAYQHLWGPWWRWAQDI